MLPLRVTSVMVMVSLQTIMFKTWHLAVCILLGWVSSNWHVWWIQAQLLVKRSWRQISRDRATIMARTIANVSAALIFGSIFNRMKLSQTAIQDRLGLLQVTAVWMCLALLVLAFCRAPSAFGLHNLPVSWTPLSLKCMRCISPLLQLHPFVYLIQAPAILTAQLLCLLPSSPPLLLVLSLDFLFCPYHCQSPLPIVLGPVAGGCHQYSNGVSGEDLYHLPCRAHHCDSRAQQEEL